MCVCSVCEKMEVISGEQMGPVTTETLLFCLAAARPATRDDEEEEEDEEQEQQEDDEEEEEEQRGRGQRIRTRGRG